MTCNRCGGWIDGVRPHLCPPRDNDGWEFISPPRRSSVNVPVTTSQHKHGWKDELIEPEPGAVLFVQRCTDFICNEVRLVCRLK
jgi:hypothetical protein